MQSEPKERVELLAAGNRNGAAVAASNSGGRQETRRPPDGGIQAFSVLVAAFVVNGVIFGIINSYSVVYTVLLERLKTQKVEYAEIKAPLVGGLTIATTFFMSSVSGVLADMLGLRLTAILGGCIGAAGLFLSSFVIDHVYALCFTYGILFGLGASLIYTPSLSILGQYYKKYLGIVNGVVTVGSCAFTVFMPDLMDFLIHTYGLEMMFRFISLFGLGLIVCGFLFKPLNVLVVEKPSKEQNTFKAWLKKTSSIQMWKIKRYRLWALFMPIALFGYFVPYVHIKKFIEERKFDNVNLNLPLQCIAVTSAVGRLSFGFLADRQWVNKVMLQQISFYVIGALTIILPFVYTFGGIVVIALGMGLFEGGFIALIGPVAYELVGNKYATQGIGCMLAVASFPLSIGPPIAGALHSHYGSYTVSFILAGISPLIGASLMFIVSLSRRKPTSTTQINGHALTTQNDLEKGPSHLLGSKDRVEQ